MDKILITGTKLPHVPEEIKILSQHAEVVFNNTEDKAELYGILQDITVVMTDDTIIDADFLKNAPNLKMVIEYGVGYDNIDAKTAGEMGIIVSNVPDGYLREVAEHAIALMLAVSKQVVSFNSLVKKDKRWDFNAFPVLKLYDKKLGLIGCGKIGGFVAKAAAGLGMEVVVFDPYLTQEKLDATGLKAKLVSFEELLSESDVISVHTPLTPETKGMVGEEEVARMKTGVIIVNVSRRGIITEKAILSGLRSGKIFGAGLDFLEDEEALDSPLLGCGNVIVTPHSAWKSEVAAWNNEMRAVEEVVRFLKGEELKNIVNKKYLAVK